MLIENLQSWIDSARAAARVRAAEPASAPAKTRRRETAPPSAPPAPVGLRGIDRTQDIDVMDAKGRIVDRYL